jgi:hypothetical protein
VTLVDILAHIFFYAASGGESNPPEIDYFLQNGIRVVAMRAAGESLGDLIAGKDVEFKNTNEFSVAAETSVGYLTPKNPKALSDEQRERIFNLVYILSMQRSPIKSEQAGAGQPATASESKPDGSQNPQPESKPASR